MTVSASGRRPAGKSVGAASLGVVTTLAIFVASFVAFLVAPLLLLVVALLGYLAMRPRAHHARPVADDQAPASPAGFGAGAR